ncbi:MAG: secondary thiamine-phosphate synthase enzyme YjbQ [FCB group bacterium]|jgi:secondary thiamine-phosphate synthase enzyme
MFINFNFSIQTKGYCDIINISDEVEKFINKSKIKNGNVLVFSPGSTCGITSIEYEPGAIEDLKSAFDFIVPEKKQYQHNLRWGDGNGFSHIRAAITKSFFLFPIIDCKSILGTWQQIVFIDFDNRPRRRDIIVQINGE